MSGKKTRAATLKQQFLRKAMVEYEYSPAPEYDKKRMSARAFRAGTLDIDYSNSTRDVELSFTGSVCDGAWVSARVWVPREWLDSKGSAAQGKPKNKKSH